MGDPTANSHRRGRPPKFGRPGRLVALTLPEDVLDRLRELHPDPAWAIVRLCERQPLAAGDEPAPEDAPVDIALLARRRGLIVVDRQGFAGLPGVHLLPLSATRAFLALEPGRGLADLELAVADRLEEGPPPQEREVLVELRHKLREWRGDPSWRFHTRTIIVAEQVGPRGRRSGRATKRT
jgi:hypothetical protein